MSASVSALRSPSSAWAIRQGAISPKCRCGDSFELPMFVAPLRELVAGLGVAAHDHLVRPIVRRGRADVLSIGVRPRAQDIPSELTITADGAYWGSFGPTVRAGRLDTDLLLTRTVLPLAVPATALLGVLRGMPDGHDANLGIR